MDKIIYPDIKLLLPHTGTMMLLDKVVLANDDNLCAEVSIHPNSLFYDKDNNGVGAWVGVEYMAQTIAAYAGYNALIDNQPVKIGFLVGTRRYECSQAFFINGDILQIHVKNIFQADNGLGSFECKINYQKNNSNIQIASAVINAFLPDNVDEFLKDTQGKHERIL